MAQTTAPSPTLTWSAASTPSSPPLTLAAAAYDADNQTLVVFGGVTAHGMSDDTWVWDGQSWHAFPGPANATNCTAPGAGAPAEREGASMAFDEAQHELILFGGRDPSGQLCGDTWAWNGSSWAQPEVSIGKAPPPREGAALAPDPRGDLVLYGGTGYGGPPATVPVPSSGSPSSPTTSTTSPSSTSSTTRPPTGTGTVASKATAAPGTTTPGTTTLGDTWIWGGPLAGWSQEATGAGPPPLSGAAAAYDPATSTTLLFGGRTTPDGSSAPAVAAGTWQWNGTTWARSLPATIPPGTFGALAGYVPSAGGVVLTGGDAGDGPVTDGWLWNGSDWSAATLAGGPEVALGMAGAYDAAMARMVILVPQDPTHDTTELVSAAVTGPGVTSPDTGGSKSPTSSSTTSAPPGSSTPARTSKPGSATGSRSSTPGARPTATSAPKSSGPVLDSSARAVQPGNEVRLTGSGFSPGAVLVISFHSTPQLVAETRADASGGFSLDVHVPSDAAPGLHHFVVSWAAPGGRVDDILTAVMVGGPHHRISALDEAMLSAIALGLPGAAWGVMAGAGWWRRRHPVRAR